MTQISLINSTKLVHTEKNLDLILQPYFRSSNSFRWIASTSSPNSLVELQTNPAVEVFIGSLDGRHTSLDVNPTNGILYGAYDNTFNPNRLRIIDPVDGSITDIGQFRSNLQTSMDMEGIAFAPDGKLYGMSNSRLYTINPITAFATEVGYVGEYVDRIDFAPDGTLYGAGYELFRIDPNTGNILQEIGDLPTSGDIDFAPDGFIYGVRYDTETLYKINPTDASSTIVGIYDSWLRGLASIPSETNVDIDLIPYQPSGWDAPMVISTVEGTNTDANEINVGDTVYVDFALANDGTTVSDTPFQVRLLLDGNEENVWNVDFPLNPNQNYANVTDYDISSLTSGSHTLRLEIDYLDDVPENNENNNVYEKTFIIEGPSNNSIILQNSNNTSAEIWFMDGATQIGTETLPSTNGLDIVGSGDFNSDDNEDLVLQSASTSLVKIQFLDANSDYLYEETLDFTDGLGLNVVAVGDFNNDGQDDLVLQDPSYSVAGIVLMDPLTGTILLSGEVIPEFSGLDLDITSAGDFNGDGFDDLLVQKSDYSVAGIVFMNGTTVDSAQELPELAGANLDIVGGVKDYNNDGNNDFIVQSPDNSLEGIVFMNGTTINSAEQLPFSPSSFDFDIVA